MEVGLHELFVEIHFIKVPIWAKDNVHVIQTSNLPPQPRRRINISCLTSNVGKQKKPLRSYACGNDARAFIIVIRRGAASYRGRSIARKR
jgi:hypothetical protein